MKSLLRLKPYLRPFLWLILASALLAIPLAALRTAPAPLTQRLIDDMMVAENAKRAYQLPLVFIGLYLVNFVVRFFHYYLLRIVVARVNQRLKDDLYTHLSGLSADYFTSQTTGTLISRVGSDPNFVDAGLSAINSLIREPLHFVMLFSYLLYVNWRMTIMTFVIFPPLAWVFSATGRNLKRYIGKLQDENARLFSTLQETFTGIRVVHSFRLEGYLRKKFRERSSTFARVLLKSALLEEISHPLVELLTAFVIAAVIYYGGQEILAHRMTTGEFMAFFVAFGMMMNPLRLMNDVSIKLNTAAAACDRIFAVFDMKPNLHEPEKPEALPPLSREIRFENVRFAYPDRPEREILKGVSFVVRKGKAVALVGSSGAGKSSLVSLLPRIFDVTGGVIRIDDHDIRGVSLNDLRRQIAIVSQDVFLFNDTIAENIRCGRLAATQAEIVEAARKAHALEFIERLPDGFATQIGDRGAKLSGGERQRLSIARAFLREAPILILDEATSSLDSASERAVQEALDDLMKNRTTILIAHRLSTIRGADEIHVMREGLIVESGTHDELLRKSGEYSRFYRLTESGGGSFEALPS